MNEGGTEQQSWEEEDQKRRNLNTIRNNTNTIIPRITERAERQRKWSKREYISEAATNRAKPHWWWSSRTVRTTQRPTNHNRWEEHRTLAKPLLGPINSVPLKTLENREKDMVAQQKVELVHYYTATSLWLILSNPSELHPSHSLISDQINNFDGNSLSITSMTDTDHCVFMALVK